jgi:acetyltransferase
LLEQIRSSYFFGIAKSFGMGNKCDLSDEDALAFLEADAQTRVVAIHMEGTKDGKLFFQRAKAVSDQKPVILLKSGRTPLGAKAMLSHTASLAGDNALFSAACRQAGIIRVLSIEDFFDAIKAFATQPFPKGKRVAIVTFSGAAGVMGADVLYEEGLTLAPLDAETIHSVKEMGPGWHDVGNPIDIWPTIMDIGYERSYNTATRAALQDSHVDALIIVHYATSGAEDPLKDFAIFPRIKEEFPAKPLLFVLHGNCQSMEQVRVFLESRQIPAYPSVDRAARALSHLYRYGRYRETHGQTDEYRRNK